MYSSDTESQWGFKHESVSVLLAVSQGYSVSPSVVDMMTSDITML